MQPPKWYLLCALIGYAFPFLWTLGILFYETQGKTAIASWMVDSWCYIPLGTAVYFIEFCAAWMLDWVSWFERPAQQVIRHHLGFLWVAGSFVQFRIFEQPLCAHWLSQCMAFRLWLCCAGLTFANETFIVFQNFMVSPKSRWVSIFQPCLALFVMAQSIIFGLPLGVYVLFGIVGQEALTTGSISVALLAVGIVTQIAANISIQLVDSIKVARKIMRVLSSDGADTSASKPFLALS
eukprot:TRINITY_DN67388_c0_g1_i1.p1 TRINITY_DN67388_c0_g1~~TRINITY_DN67388_c0_g1_i1.p1  ORF type:complete len:237 (-),score=17.92 TRINITY_DN67388_c0_g1_i1:424-1134(-)